MKSLFVVISVLAAVGCTSTPKVSSMFTEPVRSQIILGCMVEANLLLTTCLCHERILMEYAKGDQNNLTKITKEMIDDVRNRCDTRTILQQQIDEQEATDGFTKG